MQTAIEKAIEKYDFRLAIEKKLIEDAVMSTTKDIHRNRVSVLEKCIFDLQSLLPTERSQIEAAFDIGKNGSIIMTGSDYYQTTYKD